MIANTVSSKKSVRTAFRFGVLGVATGIGGFLSSDSEIQIILISLAAVFLFGALLAYTLSSGRYLQWVVHESVYADMAANETALVDSFDLQERLMYVPRSGRDPAVSLFVPKHADFTMPRDSELDSLLVRTANGAIRGVSLRPSGGRLYSRFEEMLETELSDNPSELAAQLADGLVEGFELVDSVNPKFESAHGILTFGIDGCPYDLSAGLEDPVQSFLAVGIAVGLDIPVTVESTVTDGDQHDFVVQYRWVEEDW